MTFENPGITERLEPDLPPEPALESPGFTEAEAAVAVVDEHGPQVLRHATTTVRPPSAVR